MMRASVSRPISSVPIGWSQLGARSRVEAGSLGSTVQTKRPKSAVRTTPPTMIAPAMPIGLRHRAGSASRLRAGTAVQTPSAVLIPDRSRDADPRIEVAVDDVDEEVDDDEDRRDQQRRRLDHRVVALLDRMEQGVADAGKPEDDLGDRGAADQDTDLETDDGHDRDERVPKRMLADHCSARH